MDESENMAFCDVAGVENFGTRIYQSEVVDVKKKMGNETSLLALVVGVFCRQELFIRYWIHIPSYLQMFRRSSNC